jgi:thiaminase/transcriptional activator TenA
VSVADLLVRHEACWQRATRHPFLSAVHDGSLPESAFDTWLVQDYRFVGELLRFQARLLGRAPRSAQAVLAAGAAALVDEMTWFEQHAHTRRIDLAAAPEPATQGIRSAPRTSRRRRISHRARYAVGTGTCLPRRLVFRRSR